MPSQWLTLHLQADAVVTAQWQTLGGHKGLDYFPGATLLGAAAQSGPFDPDLLLSGKVRFSDALPYDPELGLGFPMPLSFHTLKGERDRNLINGLKLSASQWQDLTSKGKQPQQMREGYFTAGGSTLTVNKRRAMKTAIDRNSHSRALDAALFGYESIAAGSLFATRIDADTEEQLQSVLALLGTQLRIGRSRTAEYGGSVRVERIQSSPLLEPSVQHRNDAVIHLYLASDLALHSTGQPRLQPCAADFALPVDAKLDHERSFLKARSYAPWIRHFNCHGMERQVLKRGSVLTFTLSTPLSAEQLNTLQAKLAGGIGLYRNEGLGCVLLNPALLFPAEKPLPDARPVMTAPTTIRGGDDNELLVFLQRKNRQRSDAATVERESDQWATELFALHKEVDKEMRRSGGKAPGKAQWGVIRGLALKHLSGGADLVNALPSKQGWQLEARANGNRPSSLRNNLKTRLENFAEMKDCGHLAPRILFQTAALMQKKLARGVKS